MTRAGNGLGLPKGGPGDAKKNADPRVAPAFPGRIANWNEDAERAVLGSLMALEDAGLVARALGRLRAEDFHEQKHRVIFEAIVALRKAGSPHGWQLVKAELDRRGALAEVRHELPQLPAGDFVPAAVESYAATVAQCAQHRREVASLAEALARAQRGEEWEPILGELRAEELERTDVEYLDLETLAAEGIPAIPWLLPGWLAEKDVALVAGAGGIGKSTTVADIGMAVASGREWCGVAPTRPVRVLYFDEEQGENDTARMLLRLGAPHENFRAASGQGIRLDAAEGVARLEREVASFRPGVVILDSVQQVFGSTDENSATEIGGVYGHLFSLRDKYGLAFVLVHHKKKQGHYQVDTLELVRGSTAHGTQASTVWYAWAAGGNRLNVTQAKRRSSSKRSLVIAYEEEGENGPITLTGVGTVDEAEGELFRAQEWILVHMRDQGSPVRRAAIVEAAKAEGYSERNVDRALKQLRKLKAVTCLRRGVYALPGELGGNLAETGEK